MVKGIIYVNAANMNEIMSKKVSEHVLSSSRFEHVGPGGIVQVRYNDIILHCKVKTYTPMRLYTYVELVRL